MSATKILFLGSAPTDQARLRLDVEAREIEQGLRRGQESHRFEFVQRFAMRPRDIQQALLDHRPNVVHFAGHGQGEAGICFESADGKAQWVSADALRSVFALVSDQVACVILNACYAEVQAKAIAQEIGVVIGMRGQVSDRAAVAFATGFYDAVSGGKSYQTAFQWGETAVALEGIPKSACQPILHAHLAQPTGDQPETSRVRKPTSVDSSPTAQPPSSNPPLGDLRAILAKIFPSSGEIKLIVSDAGVDWSRIQANQAAERIWLDVLENALHNEMLLTVVQVALQRYPANTQLQKAVEIATQAKSNFPTSEGQDQVATAPSVSAPGSNGRSPRQTATHSTPNFRVNSVEDGVLCMHPDSVAVWQEVIPGATQVTLGMLEIHTPPGGWHRSAPIDAAAWRDVAAEIETTIRQLGNRSFKRLHVLPRGPFALGALLGSHLGDFGRQLILYQDGNRPGQTDAKKWCSWGPTWRFPHDSRQAPFFEDVPEFGLNPIRQGGDVVVILDVTGQGRSSLEGTLQPLQLDNPLATVHLKAREPGRGAIQTDGDIDQAAGELDEAFRKISEIFPEATAHVFCYAPLGLLIRASCRLHLRSIPFIIYERILDESGIGYCFVPAVRFPERRLLIDTA